MPVIFYFFANNCELHFKIFSLRGAQDSQIRKVQKEPSLYIISNVKCDCNIAISGCGKNKLNTHQGSNVCHHENTTTAYASSRFAAVCYFTVPRKTAFSGCFQILQRKKLRKQLHDQYLVLCMLL